MTKNLCSLSQARLDVSKLNTVYDIMSAYEAISTLQDIATAQSCQPRHYCDETKSHTPSGEIVEQIADWLSAQMQILEEMMMSAAPRTKTEAEYKVQMLVSRAADCGDSPQQMLALIQSLTASSNDAAV
jgi:hypothetical protein